MTFRIAALAAALSCLSASAFATGATGDAGGASAFDAAPKVMGDPAAPVTLIEFASMSCPHCATFHAEHLPDIERKWIDTGKVKLEFRDFPLNAPAVFGAALAHCAPPDRYFAWIDLLFERQREWSLASFDMNARQWQAFLDGGCPRGSWPGIWEELAGLGKLGGMPERRVGECLCNMRLQNALLESRSEGAREYDIESTPSFVLDGETLDGFPTDRDFERALAARGGG